MHKASIISIQDTAPKKPAKVEESVIMMDYFNPTKKQMTTLEEFY